MNTRVGVMALGAFIILVWVLFFPVRGVSPFTNKITVTGYYERVDGLRRNAPVYFRGVEVGSVKSVEIEPGRAQSPLKVVVAVERRVVHLLPKSTRMDIVAQGLLGDVFVEMVPGDSGTKFEPLAEGDLLATKPYSSVLASMNDLSGDVKAAMVKVNTLLARAQSSDTSVGRLFTEDDLYHELVGAVRELKTVAERVGAIEKTINEKLLDPKTKESVDKAVATAQRVLDSADTMTSKAAAVRWHLTLGTNKYEGSTYSAIAGLRIIPNKDRFYYGGLEWFNGLVPHGPDDLLGGGYAGYDAALGFRVLQSPVFFRGGLKRTNVNTGLDVRLQDLVAWLPLELTADAYKFSQPVSQFDLGASLAFMRAFRLTGGVDDIGNTPRYRAGLTIIYDDEDLTSILVKAKTGL